mmetsp:Transcript_71676/g.226453  ORF Transcript_71676/g.226453 Transcript_71676/m.226453 type:complete len:463 (+) Transcript_71676:448-1836(+)
MRTQQGSVPGWSKLFSYCSLSMQHADRLVGYVRPKVGHTPSARLPSMAAIRIQAIRGLSAPAARSAAGRRAVPPAAAIKHCSWDGSLDSSSTSGTSPALARGRGGSRGAACASRRAVVAKAAEFNPSLFGAGATPPKYGLDPVFDTDIDDYVAALDAVGGGDGLIAVASSEGTIHVLSAASGEIVSTFEGHEDGANCIKFSPDGSALASGGWDGMVRVWSLAPDGKSHELLAEEKVETDGRGLKLVDAVAFSPDGSLVAAAAGTKIKVLAVPAAGEKATAHALTPVGSSVSGMQISKDSEVLASCYGGVYCVPVTAEGEANLGGVYSWQTSIVSLAMSPCEKWIAGGTQDQSVHIWNKETGDDFAMWGYQFKVGQLHWSSDSRYLATAGGSEPNVWDFSGTGPIGSAPIVCMGMLGKITALQMQPGGTLLAGGGNDGGLLLWDVSRFDEGNRNKMCNRAPKP